MSDGTLEMVRLAGTFAGIVGRRRQAFEATQLDEAAIGFAAWALEQVITPILPLVPGYARRFDLPALRAGGLVRLILSASRLEASRLGKAMATLLLVLQMNRYAVEKRGATVHNRHDSLASNPRAFLDAALSPTTRRLARRALADQALHLGIKGLRVDFAAMYRTGTVPAIYFLSASGSFPTTIGASRDGIRLLLLGALVFACDCWTLRENPLNVAFAALIQHASLLWESGSPNFRTAMTEALVLATCQTLPPEKVQKLDRMEAVTVLEGEALDWASSVVIAFHELRAHSPSRFRLMRFLSDLVNKAKHQGPNLEPLDLHLSRLGHRVVALDGESGVDVADNRADPGRVIPEIHELRARLQVDRLTSRERQVLALRMKDMPFDAIGRELGISASTARVLIHRVRRASGRSTPRRRRGRR